MLGVKAKPEAKKGGWDEVGGETSPLVSKLILLLDRAVGFIQAQPIVGDSPIKRERFRAFRDELICERDLLVGTVESGSGKGK
jgi:hypothetical protein